MGGGGGGGRFRRSGSTKAPNRGTGQRRISCYGVVLMLASGRWLHMLLHVGRPLAESKSMETARARLARQQTLRMSHLLPLELRHALFT